MDSDVSNASDAPGKFFSKFGMWIKSRIYKDAEQEQAEDPHLVDVELHPTEKHVGAAICLTGVVVIIAAKRLGLMRFIRI